ncbi:MAG TPA: plasmid stabilization protein [Candidatus Moranbacteria bacterium]|nr:plasmid stabilization protein [Candidatus Moranbacteria bacterium]
MKIIYAREALKDVIKIKSKKLKDKVKSVILDIKSAKNLRDIKSVKKLAGHPSAFRIRVGDYRLGFYFENDTVEIARFLKRSDIYKVFPKQ